MSSFHDAMVEAYSEMEDQAGEEVFIDGQPATGIVDESTFSIGNHPGGARQSAIQMQVHISIAEFQRVGGRDGSKVEVPSRKLKGRVSSIEGYTAGHYTLLIGSPNART
jgi:hypothetical protein